MDLEIILYGISILSVVVAFFLTYGYRNKLNKMELYAELNRLDRQFELYQQGQACTSEQCRRHTDESIQMLWEHIRQLESSIGKLKMKNENIDKDSVVSDAYPYKK